MKINLKAGETTCINNLFLCFMFFNYDFGVLLLSLCLIPLLRPPAQSTCLYMLSHRQVKVSCLFLLSSLSAHISSNFPVVEHLI